MTTSGLSQHLLHHHPESHAEYLLKKDEALKQRQAEEAIRLAAEDPELVRERTCPDCQRVFSCKQAMLVHRKVILQDHLE